MTYKDLQADLSRASHEEAYPRTHKLGKVIQRYWDLASACEQEAVLKVYNDAGEYEHGTSYIGDLHILLDADPDQTLDDEAFSSRFNERMDAYFAVIEDVVMTIMVADE